MLLAEHPGPKGQILLRGAEDRPVWFSSARDAIAFVHLAEEPRAIRAIYVSDMTKAEDWDDPGATNWVEARRAHFVIGSSRRGGMGAEEAVPFSDRATAERFAALHGGRVLAFGAVPRDWALGGEAAEPAGPVPAPSPPGGEAARHAH
jgi:copper chaperone NosL